MKELIRVINDHRNLEHFMTIKQFNRKQARWTEFLFEFNFKIKYCSNIQETKFDNLIRRSQDISLDSNDFRNQFQRQTIFKTHHFSKEFCIFKKLELQINIVKAVVLISLLQVHNINRMTELINMIYVLIEKEFLFEKVVFNDVEQKSLDENDVSLSSKQLMNKIRETYSKNERLQQIINVKKIEERKISIDLRKDYSLKLKDCKVNDDLLLINDKIVIFENDLLRINVIKMHHDELVAEYSSRIDIFVNVSQHY